MSVIFVGGIYDYVNEREVIDNTRVWVDFSGNNFQRKILAGFEKEHVDIPIFSAPSIGDYPKNYTKSSFKGFKEKTDKYHYVNFCNIWGLRNNSRANHLKKALKKYGVKNIDSIVVYSVHTPFLDAAVYAKKKNPNIKICLIVADIPEYMNLNKKKSLLYRVGKKYDIYKFYKLNQQVDSFVFLTSAMNDLLNKKNRPYIIQEGVNDLEVKEYKPSQGKEKHVVYTGKLTERFGIMNLVNAVLMIEDENVVLDLCGDGELLDTLRNNPEISKRVICHGPLSQSEIKKVKEKASVFVNPRLNNEEFTKFSFPSKNIEYLVSGLPVVAYLLDGMKQDYKDFLWVPKDDSIAALSEAIKNALDGDNTIKNKKFMDYEKENLDSGVICKKIIGLCNAK